MREGGQFRPHKKYRLSSLIGLRHPEMALRAAFRTGSIFQACDHLLQTGDAYSTEEKHIARAVVRIVLASVPPVGVRSGFCVGLSNVTFVRKAAV